MYNVLLMFYYCKPNFNPMQRKESKAPCVLFDATEVGGANSEASTPRTQQTQLTQQ